jgi:ribonuclease HII
MLPQYPSEKIVAGCDEAGRGCLAGPVYAACVILPEDFYHPDLNDSKVITEKKRNELRSFIEENAVEFAVSKMTAEDIDRVNILQATFLAMRHAILSLKSTPELLLIDGNQFKIQIDIPFKCIVKGDSTFASIAAASILAKTYRDEHMRGLALECPVYAWERNKGYGTREHIHGIQKAGYSKYHRRSFKLRRQGKLF